MSTLGVVQSLTARGVVLATRGTVITIEAPAGALAPQDLADLRAIKPAVLPLLDGTAVYQAHPTQPCYRCHSACWWREHAGGWVCAACHPDRLPAERRAARLAELAGVSHAAVLL